MEALWAGLLAAIGAGDLGVIDSLMLLGECALFEGDLGVATACAGLVVLVEHLQAERYLQSPRALSVLAMAGPAGVSARSPGLLAAAGAAVAHDYGALPSWPATDVSALRERARLAPPDIALALGCALAELCERHGQDAAFADLQAEFAARVAPAGASPFWRCHWAVASAWQRSASGHAAEARDLLVNAENEARLAGLHSTAAAAALQRARLVEARRDPLAATVLATQAVAGADAQRQPLRLADLADVQARAALVAGDPQAALAHARRAMGLVRVGGDWPGSALSYALNEVYALLHLGAFDDALACLEACRGAATTPYLADRLQALVELGQLAAADRRDRWGEVEETQMVCWLRRLRRLEWPGVLPLQPALVARLFARALEADDRSSEADWVRSAIRFRGLPPPDGLPECWPWPLRLRLLGDFRAEGVDGTPLGEAGGGGPHKAPAKPLALLRRLASQGYRAVPMAELTKDLWPDGRADDPQRSFEITLARLRRLLAWPEAVLVHERHVRLNPRCVWIDQEALVQRLDAADRSPDATTLEVSMERALRMYRGPCLDGDSQPWAELARRSLRKRLAASLLRTSRLTWVAADQRQAWLLRAAAADPGLAALWSDESLLLATEPGERPP